MEVPSTTSCISLGVLLRALLLVYGQWQDRNLDVKFTDVDYQVFTQAAAFVHNGSSPFLRPTYRYTPLLAIILLPNITLCEEFGKILFCLCDILTGYLIYLVTRHNVEKSKDGICRLCSLLWLLNPLTAVVSSRGNAESLMSVLVILSLYLILKKKVAVAGLVYGLSVHFKIYPAIYSVPFYLSLNTGPWWKKFVYPTRQQVVLVTSSIAGFALPTAYCYLEYGHDFIREAYTYHLGRVDTRHNFSPYFYSMYLGGFRNKWLGFLPFVFQVAVVLAISIKFSQPRNLAFCMFANTLMFVSFNKVCTSQYFMWYLCLLPLVIPRLERKMSVGVKLITAWFGSQGIWLLAAYYLEFGGVNTFVFIWAAGLLFFAVNLTVLKILMDHLKA